VITRPLDLASRLRGVARGWDALFYVNVGALAVFFLVFGSRFVLAPGLPVDFALPAAGGAATARWTTDVVIAVPASDLAVVEGAVVDFDGLGPWLRDKARESGGAQRPRLLVQASDALPARDLTRLYALAAEAGFGGVLIAVDGVEGRRP
jgi:hypothetical protein